MKMKILAYFFLTMISFGLVGCGSVQEVSNGVDYVKGATDYLNKVLTFKSETTQFLAQGKFDQESRQAFLPKVEQMKKDVAAFEALKPPSIDALKNIHQQITDFNTSFKPTLDMMEKGLKAETPESSMNQLEQKISAGLSSVHFQGIIDQLKTFMK